jgi:hypothetical protein
VGRVAAKFDVDELVVELVDTLDEPLPDGVLDDPELVPVGLVKDVAVEPDTLDDDPLPVMETESVP